MASIATGTVTLLFTDIEGSTKLLRQLGDRYHALLADHHRLLREAFQTRGGNEVDTAGDGLFYVFPSARAAIAAAVAGQRALGAQDWPADVRVRMGIHTGEPLSGDGGFVGLDVHRASRICGSGHGGQVIVSKTTRDLADGDLPEGVSLVDLGEYQLKDLPAPDRLYQVVAPGLLREFPPLRSIDSRPNNLPRQLTTFVGRQREIGEAKAILASAPLLTLTGPGGVGKTRLAIELGADLLDDYEDGVWFVDLGPVSDPEFVGHTIATSLGVMDIAGQPILDTVIDHLRRRHVLLVLDNCEHLLDAAAQAVDALLRACAQVRVVSTSREGFAIPGEAVFPVPSLSAPEGNVRADELAHFESVRLFTERAAAAQPGFAVTERNATAIAQVCRRLDGVPLALELAAARVRALPVEQIATRLDDRFRLLTGSSRITVPRHQTLRQTIDWSHDLLADDERAVLRRLAAFAGGCSLEAAEAVCADERIEGWQLLDILSRLVDKSLVVADTAADEARYRMLETIREYARDRLIESGEAEAILRRHRDWFLALVEKAAPEFFRGVESATWLERLDREHDNLRAALQWSTDEVDEAPTALQLAAGLWRFWEIRGHIAEGRSWLERALAATDGEISARRADAYTGAGILAFMQGDHEAAHGFHEQSLALHRRVGDYAGIAYAANNLANAALLSGDFAAARRLYEPGLAWARAQGNVRPLGFALVNMAEAVALDGEPELARQQYEEGVEVFRSMGDRWGEAFALDSLAVTLERQGGHAEAERLHGQALAISRELGDQRGIARALTHLGDVASRTNDRRTAKRLYLESFEIRRALGDQAGKASAIEKIAGVVAADDARGAAILLGSAEAVRDSIRAPVPPTVRVEYEACRDSVRGLLGEAAFEEARAEGRRLTPGAALATLPL
ncbi:MAG TPA: tetratricopeptide repeat protein [Candidatus Limnocylindrales bacterium]